MGGSGPAARGPLPGRLIRLLSHQPCEGRLSSPAHRAAHTTRAPRRPILFQGGGRGVWSRVVYGFGETLAEHRDHDSVATRWGARRVGARRSVRGEFLSVSQGSLADSEPQWLRVQFRSGLSPRLTRTADSDWSGYRRLTPTPERNAQEPVRGSESADAAAVTVTVTSLRRGPPWPEPGPPEDS